MRASQRARAMAARKGLRKVRFKRKQPLGTVYYTNPNAKPITPGAYFGKENIESLAVRGFVKEPWNMGELHGGNGAIAYGKVKFKGAPAKPVIIKGYFRPSAELEAHLVRIVERLKMSKAKHPKMCVFPLTIGGKRNLYLLMESYTKNERGMVLSKLEPYGRIVNKLRLHNPQDVETLKKVLNETAELAKVGLIVPQSLAVSRDFIALGLPEDALRKIAFKQIDTFNNMTLKNGQTQIIAQDIDELQIADNPKQAWKQSAQNISEVVLSNFYNQSSHGKETVKKLVREIASKHRL